MPIHLTFANLTTENNLKLIFIMSVKQFYLPPETMVLPIQPEGPLCTSNLILLSDPGLSDYELLDASDIAWE